MDRASSVSTRDLVLPRHPRAAAATRRAVAALLPDCSDIVDLGQLLVTETVSNAVRHTGSNHVVVRIAVSASGELYCAVFDTAPDLPTPGSYSPHQPGLSAESGRGLFLLDSLSQAWGCEQERHGKWVWFRLSPQSQPTESADSDTPAYADALTAA
ncbi:ATP-binding protein [Streptomyces sp. bgisy031]|uniref:ATP-binding protein n=1 Tax=Streptomyces sp. bgisy031 TaxID=3413772 RepID=UPI003D762F43